MVGRNDDIVELLEYARLAVLNANSSTSRAARANLQTALLDRRGRISETAIRFSNTAFAASDFLREMAWFDDDKDRARFERYRGDFAQAMECLIFEVGVARLKASVVPVSYPTFAQTAAALFERVRLARTI